MSKCGLFVGITTLDLIYLAPYFPHPNEKLRAIDSTISAGGPATNASVTFSVLGNQARLLSVLGKHPITNLIRTDLENYQIEHRDLQPSWANSPPTSSIIVTQNHADRAVISLNATRCQAEINQIPDDALSHVDLVLIDGHQMAVGSAIAQQAHAKNIPIIIDGGSWKEGWESILPVTQYAICSANFYPPNCNTQTEVFQYLKETGIPYIAITQGEKPILYQTPETQGEIAVPQITAKDTLGAGDIFHGAFCHYILQQEFTAALSNAAKIAAESCTHFGTRNWIN
ncbi:sugar kinase [Euhalothece natronophila Z-M001]|uniref:Sugar kinase n=1 Tax=Euhalothece natronophila Z-M001 TaxID=522448 RepID=A0A5B8NSA0_9CHRO|nr:sugar kinase [Euhalothece natronophila]QDZ40920.1 sugar kinase [Euhalothece natronophila Z-M001]